MIEARATVGGWDDSESAWGIKLTRCVFLRKAQESSTIYTSRIGSFVIQEITAVEDRPSHIVVIQALPFFIE